MEQPYADRPGYRGELLWDREALTTAFTVCLRRRWPVGVHAMGDRANALLLAAMKDAAAAAGPVPPGMLVIEHGGLIGGPDRRGGRPRRARHRAAGAA